MSAVRFSLSLLYTLLMVATLSACGGGGGGGGSSDAPTPGVNDPGGGSGGNPAGGGSGGTTTTPKIATGTDHTVAIAADGSLWAWGSDGGGQLGQGSTPESRSSSPMRIGDDNDWVSIAAGGSITLAVKSDGSLWFTGMVPNAGLHTSALTRVGTENNWSQVAAGHSHMLALKSDGSLWAWGFDMSGDLGLGVTSGTTAVIRLTPERVGTATDWIEIAAGNSHSLAIKSDHSLWAWGENEKGQLGLGDTVDRNVPTRVGTALDWSSVAAGVQHSLAIKSDGSLWSWGNNYGAQLGNGISPFEVTVPNPDVLTPTRVGNDTDWSLVAAGLRTSVAMKSNGSVWAWGFGQDWELGLETQGPYTTPTQIGTDTDWIAISQGSAYPARHTVALKSDGSRWSWGYNNQGQLGVGDYELRQEPTQIPAAPPPPPGGGTSSCLVANWKRATCGGTKQQTLRLDANGSGAFTNPDCNDICNPLVFNFNYTVNGSSVTLNYGVPAPVECSGYGTQQPPQPNNDSFTYTCTATQLTTTTSSGTVSYTR